MEEYIKGGTSPFIYRDGLKLVREEAKTVSREYFRRCLETERINGYDMQILEHLYTLGYLSSHMMQLLYNKPYKSLQKRIAKLRNNGFIVRYHFEHVDVVNGAEQTVNTAFFYGLGSSVRDFYGQISDGPARTVFTDVINVLKQLALNQFIIDCMILDGPVIKRMPGYVIQQGDYLYKAGYAIILPSLEANTCYVPIVSRRENNWPDQLIPNLKVILASKIPEKATAVIPIVICEDMVHMAQVREEIAKDEKIKNLPVYYAHDLEVGAGDLFGKLYIYGGDNENGQPRFILKDCT